MEICADRISRQADKATTFMSRRGRAVAAEMRRDEQLVRVFLRTYKGGAFGSRMELVTHRKHPDVECVAQNAAGDRLAIEHTLLENFPGIWSKSHGLAEVAHTINHDLSLRVPERVIFLFLPPEAFDPSRRWRWEEITTALTSWCQSSLADLPLDCSMQQICVGSPPRELEFEAVVHKKPGSPGVLWVRGGMPVAEAPMVDALKTAAERKVPKLLQSSADMRVLLLEVHGALTPRDWVIGQIAEYSGVHELDAIALAYTPGLELVGEAHFHVWRPGEGEWDAPLISAL